MIDTCKTQKIFLKTLALIFLLLFMANAHSHPHIDQYAGEWQRFEKGWVKTLTLYRNHTFKVTVKPQKPTLEQQNWHKQALGTYTLSGDFNKTITFHYTHLEGNIPNWDIDSEKRELLGKYIASFATFSRPDFKKLTLKNRTFGAQTYHKILDY